MSRRATRTDDERPVRVAAGEAILEGMLGVPQDAAGIVLFAHGSGSGRLSPRNQYVAQRLRQAGLATLLLDLLTIKEEAEDEYTGHFRFDIRLLSNRLVGATDWVKQESATRDLNTGYFGASTGAAAALIATVERPGVVDAVVSRGGRPDLAEDALDRVKAPTLLIVGGHDFQVITLNRNALQKLKCEKELAIVPGATHLFEESGALEEVARLAADWFNRHLAGKKP